MHEKQLGSAAQQDLGRLSTNMLSEVSTSRDSEDADFDPGTLYSIPDECDPDDIIEYLSSLEYYSFIETLENEEFLDELLSDAEIEGEEEDDDDDMEELLFNFTNIYHDQMQSEELDYYDQDK